MENSPKTYSGPIAWMTNNHVAANLLMFIILIGGFFSAKSIKQEVFPEFDLDIISISCAYPGASPSEVEQGILLVLEETVRAVDGVKKVTSRAVEGAGSVTLELLNNAKSDKILNDIKNEVDRINNFPENMETPSVSLAKSKRDVISVIIAGDEDHATLHSIAEQMRSDLLRKDDISQVELAGVRGLEVAVNISQDKLQSYGLTLGEVAMQIKAFSLEMPGGSLESNSGTILVRLSDKSMSGDEFANIIIKGNGRGAEVRLGDIAEITDGYEDSDLAYKFNGKPAVMITAYRVGKETPIKVAKAVKSYLEEARESYPESIEFSTWNDKSILLQGRINLLVKNALTGLLLVIIVLSLFLQKRLAMWVALGIPISFLGTFLLMPGLNSSINMITLFALIITLGMVVDDAIIIAENVYHKMQKGIPPLQAAIEGAQEMAMPVTFSILTTIAAFFPLMMLPGIMGKVFFMIPVVVITVLVFSWLESFFILPAHLAHMHKKEGWLSKKLSFIDTIQEATNRKLLHFIEHKYQPFLRHVLKHRYTAVSISIAVLFLVVGTVPAGILKFSFFPRVEGDVVSATIRLPYGVPISRSEEVAKTVLAGSQKALKKLKGEESYRGTFSKIGEISTGGGPRSGKSSGSHLISVSVDLGPSDSRKFGSKQFSAAWKKAIPPIVGVESFLIASRGGPSAGKDVHFELLHSSSKVLGEASLWLANKFTTYSELSDIENSFAAGKPQLDFKMRTGASSLGITARTVAQTMRNSFYGAEAVREQRGRNELKVVVRFPKEERATEYNLDNLLIKSRQGGFVPLNSVASMTRGSAPTEISRDNGLRIVSVSADVKKSSGISGEEMVRSLTSKDGLIEEMLQRFPGLSYQMSGQSKEQKETFSSLLPNFIMALFVIFTLLAVPFKSYIQPIIVMTAIPFGIVGAFLGHLLLGYSLSIMSMMGIIALSGVVVNDSLVLVDATNKYRLKGYTVKDALITAGMRRFRPIMLTSVTTFFGLMPMIFETSRQAKFLIPMAISLGFGILFVTVIVLLIVPTLYLWLERIRYRLGLIELSEVE